MQWKITSNKHALQRAKAVKLYIIKPPVSGKKHGLLCGRKLSNQNSSIHRLIFLLQIRQQ